MLQTRRSVWGQLAYSAYGRHHLRYRKRLCIQWRRPQGSILRRRVMEELSVAEVIICDIDVKECASNGSQVKFYA